MDYGYVHSYSLFKECRERGQAQRAKPQPVAGSAAKKAFPRARVVAVEHQGSGPARRRVETLSCGHTRAPGWKRGRMMPLLEVGDAVACSACRKAPSGSQNGVKAFAARDVFTLFQDQTDADEAYFDLFSPWKRWSLRLLNPRQIQSYTEPGAIQNGFSDKEDEEAARRYASLGIENAPPIFVKPFPHPPYAWVHIDGQTRARAALLSGKPIYGYAPILES